VAERLALAWMTTALDGEPGALVSSAGLEARDGQAMDPRSAEALTLLGGDPSGFVSRRLTAAMAEEADLVLTMTRRQRRSVLALTPRGLRRTYTLPEAADLLGRADLSGLSEEQSLQERTRLLAARLDAARAVRPTSPADDIPDPIQRPARVHRAVAALIADALKPLVTTLVPSASADQLVQHEEALTTGE
jgi:protein-tyrosine phosphatase